MKNIKLVLEYDGTNYLGWQRQPQGMTIQEVIEDTLNKITSETITVIGSGRTDSGVHALAQVANFKTEGRMTSLQFQKALNSVLPKDIVVKEVSEVDINFHAQLDVKSKTYLYKILNRPYPSALERNKVWFLPESLDIPKMAEAARMLGGQHDFCGFALSNTTKTTVREVINVSLEKKPDGLVEFEIESAGFLRGMVRLIVGTLVQVGKGKIAIENFREILESGEKTNLVFSAPPSGLYLKEVRY
ncbi:MAG: tRNA pseudouridine(38-40) synthase TruA [Thermodesulfobacteriota bacterium]